MNERKYKVEIIDLQTCENFQQEIAQLAEPIKQSLLNWDRSNDPNKFFQITDIESKNYFFKQRFRFFFVGDKFVCPDLDMI